MLEIFSLYQSFSNFRSRRYHHTCVFSHPPHFRIIVENKKVFQRVQYSRGQIYGMIKEVMSKKEKYEVIVRVLELRNAGAELQPLHIQFIRNKHVASSRPNKSRRAIRETNIFTAVWHDSDDMAFDLNLQHGSSRMNLLKSFSSDDSHEPNSVTFGDGSHDKKKIRVHVLNAANQCLGHGHFFVTGAVNQRVALRLKKKGSAKATTLSAFFTLFFELNINPSNNSKQTQGDAFHGHVDPSSFLAVLDRDSNAVEIVSSSSSCVVSSCVMPNARGSNSSTPSAVLTDTSSETLPLPTSSRELGVHQRRRTDSMYGVLLSSMTCANDTRLNNDAKNDLPLMVEMNENGSVAESSVLTNEFQIIPSVGKLLLMVIFSAATVALPRHFLIFLEVTCPHLIQFLVL